jgi:SDR family mycofactocin-dependent oxidoreductase
MSPGRVEGKVAFITGAARGQGRAHAVRLAEEGADIIAVDICGQIATVPAAMATRDDLDETVSLVKALDRRIVAAEADVRDYAQLAGVLKDGVAELGRLDIVCANAGIYSIGQLADLTEEAWQDTIDVNLTGEWHTCKAAIPHLLAGGQGGSMILISSSIGLRAIANLGHYGSAKHGVVGLMRTLALELAPHSIRVNSIHPGCVDTLMIQNPSMYSLLMPDVEAPTREQVAAVYQSLNALPVPWAEPRDISNAVLFLASDEARYVTGVALPVDAGVIIK